MPIVNGNDVEDGVYIANTPIIINTSEYLVGLLIQISSIESTKACNIIYARRLTRHGWYYDEMFRKDEAFGHYSPSTIAKHINDALGTSFVGLEPTYLSDDEVTKGLIVGIIAPVEGYSGLRNLNVIEDELADI